MGYVMATSPRIVCGNVFSYNPMRVPSTSAVTGRREPVCERCFGLINERRVAQGLPPFVPLPGAYEAADESELVWNDDD
jgi:hypothetical protein